MRKFGRFMVAVAALVLTLFVVLASLTWLLDKWGVPAQEWRTYGRTVFGALFTALIFPRMMVWVKAGKPASDA